MDSRSWWAPCPGSTYSRSRSAARCSSTAVRRRPRPARPARPATTTIRSAMTPTKSRARFRGSLRYGRSTTARRSSAMISRIRAQGRKHGVARRRRADLRRTQRDRGVPGRRRVRRAQGIDGLDVRLAGLTRRGGGGAITYAPPGDDPTRHGRPADPDLHRELHERDGADPRELDLEARQSGGARRIRPAGSRCSWSRRTRARDAAVCPIDVAPQRNQAIWIEVYIPRGLPAGMYDGAVELRAGGGLRRVPVELEVFDFDAARREPR